MYHAVNVTAPQGCTLHVFDCGSYLEISCVVVHEDGRGRGIGTEAVRRVQALGRTIRLTARHDEGREQDLRRFYLGLGFRNYNQHPDQFQWIPNENEKR